MNKQKLLIVGGGGMVGATAAYACALRSVIEEIVLIDRNERLTLMTRWELTEMSWFIREIILISMTMISL